MYASLIQFSSQDLDSDFPLFSNFDFLLQLLPAPRSLQTKLTRPISATTLILHKPVHGSFEAEHNPPSHPTTTSSSFTDQVGALFEGPAPNLRRLKTSIGPIDAPFATKSGAHR